MRRKLTEADQSTIIQAIDKLYGFIMGSLTGRTWFSDPVNAIGAVKDGIGSNIELTFDNFTLWIKSLFKEGGIFNKIGKGIGGIITEVYKWLGSIIGKIPGAGANIPGFTNFAYSDAIAIGLVSALVIIAFYKIFKGLLGSSKDEENERYDRYSEAVEQGNKIIVEFYNFTEHMIYQYNYNMLSEGIFGGIFEFIGRTIKKAFKFVGDIIKDVYRGAKKHPIFSFFVIVLCFFICFCMKNPVAVAAGDVANMRTTQMPGLIGQLLGNAKNAVNTNLVNPIMKGVDKVTTIAGSPVQYAKSLIGFSENTDVELYVDNIFKVI